MTSSLSRRRWLLCLLVIAAAAPVGIAAARTTPRPPGTFYAKYHISGYGIYHETLYHDYTVAPCKPGGRGGGDDGEIRVVSTIRWETVAPETATVFKIGSEPPQIVSALVPGTKTPGILATATVTNKVTNSIQIVSCHQDGTEERKPYKVGTTCGTHTYPSGYYAGVVWPRVHGLPGERIAADVASLPVAQKQFAKDWGDCYDAVTELEPFNDYWWEVNAPFPFKDIPRKIRGKESVVTHGGKVVLDETMRQNGQGGTVHDHVDFSATNYLTWIRIS